MAEKIELLAPARDASIALAAIRCGADAVYIGAERFGAREAAANKTEDIRRVVEFAHPYYVKVYATLNTLLKDSELASAEKMIHELYEAGIDGLIIQDAGLLELDLPPVPLMASTQMDNSTPEKVRFWQDVGFSRVILARELSLEDIRRIRRATTVELECFVHGALCVGASGQCYMSYALGGRSGNRGQCAQPCRRLYTARDETGRTIVKDRHLLSLKDLNLSEHLEALIEAGINSFKIEGRMKDMAYVANTVGFYRQRLDEILGKKELRRSSSGWTLLNFQPNLEKTFNRGFTDYALTGPLPGIASIDTPKSTGEFVGTVKRVETSFFLIDGPDNLQSGDGICFFDRQRNLAGTVVNRAEGAKVYPQKISGISEGQKIYRNFDREFCRKLTSRAAQRTVRLSISLRESPRGLLLAGRDEDGNEGVVEMAGVRQSATKKEDAEQVICRQLTRLGNTIFECHDVQVDTETIYFLPTSRLNAARRALVELLLAAREKNRPRRIGRVSKSTIRFPQEHLTYMGNVLNSLAAAFYRRHGVRTIEPAAESGIDLTGRTVMTTKYCLQRELGLCDGKAASHRTLSLVDADGREFGVRFRCGNCGMEISLVACLRARPS